ALATVLLPLLGHTATVSSSALLQSHWWTFFVDFALYIVIAGLFLFLFRLGVDAMRSRRAGQTGGRPPDKGAVPLAAALIMPVVLALLSAAGLAAAGPGPNWKSSIAPLFFALIAGSVFGGGLGASRYFRSKLKSEKVPELKVLDRGLDSYYIALLGLVLSSALLFRTPWTVIPNIGATVVSYLILKYISKPSSPSLSG